MGGTEWVPLSDSPRLNLSLIIHFYGLLLYLFTFTILYEL